MYAFHYIKMETQFSNFHEKNDFDLIETLFIHNLPNKPLKNKLDLTTFCFLLSALSDNNVRSSVNLSRITTKFWEAIRKIPYFEKTFEYFSDKELTNTFKYVMYLPAIKRYSPLLVLKAYFSAKSKKIITQKTKLADISKALSFILKNKQYTVNLDKKKKKPSELAIDIASSLEKIDILKYFNFEKVDKNTASQKLHNKITSKYLKPKILTYKNRELFLKKQIKNDNSTKHINLKKLSLSKDNNKDYLSKYKFMINLFA